MIVLDTTVLAYAVGADHPLQVPCRRLVRAIADGEVIATTTIEVIPLTLHIGAEIRGVDLTRPLPEPQLTEVRNAFLKWKVIFFRDQHLDARVENHSLVPFEGARCCKAPFVSCPGYEDQRGSVPAGNEGRHGGRRPEGRQNRE